MTKIQMSNKQKNWVSPQTRSLIADRNRLREQARSQDSDLLWQQYKILKNKITSDIKKDKKQHFSKLFERCQSNNDTKALYQITKEQLGWNSGGTPLSFIIEGEKVTSPKILANIQLNTFRK